MMRKTAVALTLVAALGVTACSSGATGSNGADELAQGDPVQGGTLSVTMSSDPGTIDMASSSSQTTQFVGANVFEGLFALDETFAPREQLAESYEVSDDQREYTIKIREDVTFHDGSALDAGDVVDSLTRFMEVNFVGASVARSVDSLSASDDSTVVIQLKEPRYALIAELAHVAAFILPSEVLANRDATPLTAAESIGTGPFALTGHEPGQIINLSRFEDYANRTEDWGGYAGAKEQYLDGIDFHIVPESTSAVNGLLTGEWDFVSLPPGDAYDQLNSTEGVSVNGMASGIVTGLIFNHSDAERFGNLDARLALNKILNKSEYPIAAGLPEDLVDLTGAFVARDNSSMFSEAGQDVYEHYDPEEGVRELRELGIDNIRMTINNFPPFTAWAAVFESQLTSAGIDVTVESFDGPTVLERLNNEPGTWDVNITFWPGGVTSPAQVNWLQADYRGWYQSDEMDALMLEYDATSTDEAFPAAVDSIQELAWTDMASIMFYGNQQTSAYTDNVQGYGDFALIFGNTWISE